MWIRCRFDGRKSPWAAALRTSRSALGPYYEERYRERVLRQLSQRANKLGIQLVAAPQSV
jgi:hypothetical protein